MLDAAKGFFAVWLAGHFTQGNIRWMAIAAVAAVIGHMFPIWLGFRGGSSHGPRLERRDADRDRTAARAEQRP